MPAADLADAGGGNPDRTFFEHCIGLFHATVSIIVANSATVKCARGGFSPRLSAPFPDDLAGLIRPAESNPSGDIQ
jgi:hypothetical protein